jgi:hypothetical protein
MPSFDVCCIGTLEIYATIEADSREEAESIAQDIATIDYANETVGADTDSGTITQVLGHGINEVISVRPNAD